MYTYEDIELLAARLVATADLDTDDKNFAIDLCLLAGEMRGALRAGEPVNSEYMEDLVYRGNFWLARKGAA